MINNRVEIYKKRKLKVKILNKWVNFSSIPELMKKTVLVSEDLNFYNHKGIDYFELKEAIKKNLSKGKKVRGGSTITQQLAKNLYLSSEKTYSRKIKEFFIAKKMEKHLSKDRILSIYLNVIEFGQGVFGVCAASEKFFLKPLIELTPGEIIRIVSVIPKPLRVTPLSNSGYLKWRANLLLNRLLRMNYISEELYNITSEEFK
ncbi:MAG: biosynthetic peptidoglycan transglycosylase [Acidobacteriota bacterium]